MTELTRAVPSMQTGNPGPPIASPGAPTLEDDVLVAASRGQVELLRELLAAGAALHPDKDGRTALHYAAQEGHADTCIFLLGRGCGLDSQDAMGYSPLLRAASQGARDAVQVLLEAGCSVNIQDEHGNAAIHETCWNGFSKTAEMLVHHNCDVFLINKAGFTALHLAAQNGHNESSRVLLYAGCNPDIKNNYGDTALHTAARYGHAGVARILISARCKLSEQNKNGDSALHIAAALKRRKIAKILVESGTDVALVNKQNETAMDVAKRKEHPEIMLIISTYAKPRPQQQHLHGHHPAVTFKDEIEMVDGPIVSADDQPPLKAEPQTNNTRPEKEKKAGFFFSFKKKKKDKNKEKSSSAPTTPSTPGQKRLSSGQVTPAAEAPTGGSGQAGPGGNSGGSKSAVHGFFSRYVPRDGVQYYRDLAGNIKQGPIGYAPVCQCGPSLRHLESTLTTTKDTLHQRIDVSHHILSRRIDDIDMRTRPLHRPDMGRKGGYATDTALHQRSHRESHNSHSYHHHPHHYHHHHHHMHRPLHDADDDDDDDDDFSGDEKDYIYENSLDMGIGSRDSRDLVGNSEMPEDLEYWLTDKLASYGHCLDHHHDDSALPPRNLFADFPHSALNMGRLVRSRSDETLSASDYSGKFRKRDFYASRQAAMQQIRGWELPKSNNKPGKKTKSVTPKQNHTDSKENNRTVAANNNNEAKLPVSKRVITQAQVHNLADNDRPRSQPEARVTPGNNSGPGILSPSTNSTTSPGTLGNSTLEGMDKSRLDVVSSLAENSVSSHSRHEHLHHQQGQEINRDKPGLKQMGSSSDRSKASHVTSGFDGGSQQEAIHHLHLSNPPYPQPPGYKHQLHQSQSHDHRLSQTPQSQGDQSYRQQQMGTGSLHLNAVPAQQHLHSKGPPGTDQSSSRQVDFSSSVEYEKHKPDSVSRHEQLQTSSPYTGNGVYATPRLGLTRYQDNYGVHYNRSRALSSDALNDDKYEDVDAGPQPSDIQRSRSVDNSLEDQKPTPYSSGYSTDTGVKSATNTRRLMSPCGSGRGAQSLSPAPRATTRYRLPETSSGEAASSSSPQWQRDQQVSPSHPASLKPPMPTYRSARPKDSLRQTNSPMALPSSHNIAGPNLYSDQEYGESRPYVSSVPSDKKDRNQVYSVQSGYQKPLQSHEAPTPPQTSAHSPVRECLQHDNALLSPHLTSMAASNGGREDSTCSSNQDSGYGRARSGAERRFGAGTDTSVGTPSSSFSMERSNTPSTSDSPYASQRVKGASPQNFNTSLHNRMSHSGYVSGRGRTYSPFSSGPDGSFRSSSSESHRPEDILNKSGGLQGGNNRDGFNSQRGFSSPSNDSALSANSINGGNYNQKNVASTYAGQTSLDPSHGPGQINSSSSGLYGSGNQSIYSNSLRASGTFTKSPYTVETISQQGSNTPVTSNAPRNTTPRRGPTPPPKPNIGLYNNSHNYPVQNSSSSSSYGNENIMTNRNSYSSSGSQPPVPTNGSSTNYQTRLESQSPALPGHMTQSSVQAHVQGWYQKKLLEAAHRLRQSESYSSNPPSTPSSRNNYSAEAYSMGSTSSESPRQAVASASSIGNNSSRSSNGRVFNGYSSSPSPSPLGPKNVSYSTGRSTQPVSATAQPTYNYYQQQKQQQQQPSSFGQQPNNSNNSYNYTYSDNNVYSDSSPYSKSPHTQFLSPVTMNRSSTNNARSFPSSNSQSDTTSSQYLSQKGMNSNSNLPYPMGESNGYLPHGDDINSKMQPRPYHGPTQSNIASDFDLHNNNQYHNPGYGFRRVDGGPLRYDPIHGSDV